MLACFPDTLAKIMMMEKGNAPGSVHLVRRALCRATCEFLQWQKKIHKGIDVDMAEHECWLQAMPSGTCPVRGASGGVLQ